MLDRKFLRIAADLLFLHPGRLSVNLETNQCVGVGVPANILISAFPVVPEDIVLTLNSSSGNFLQTQASVPLGKSNALVQFNASQTGPLTLTASSELYAQSVLNLTVLGSIFTNGPSRLIQDAPTTVDVSVLPSGARPVIFVSSDNAVVSPSSFVLDSDGVSSSPAPNPSWQ